MKRVLSFILVCIMAVGSVVGFASCANEGKNLKVEIMPVKGGASGIITIVHDDGDLVTARYLREKFEELDLCGTIGIVGNRVISVDGVLTSSAAEWQEIVDTGYFEVANHTQSHTWYGFTDKAESGVYVRNDGTEVSYSYPDGHMTNEIAGAAERLREVFPGQRVQSFIMAGFGTKPEFDGRNKLALEIIADNSLSQRYTGGNATINGVKIPYMNDLKRLNYRQLNSYMVTAKDDWETDWYALVDNAISYGGWGIYCFHNIWPEEKPSGHNVAQSKATPVFEYIAEKCDAGELWCATMQDATLYTQQYAKAKAELEYSDGKITVALRDFLDNKTYDMALTVRIDVPKSWELASFSYNGSTVKYQSIPREDGTKYIEVDMVPDLGKAEIVKG